MGLCSSSETFDQSTSTAQGGLRSDSNGGAAAGGQAAAAMMMGGNNLSSSVELFISCKNIKNLDQHSLSDCFCVLEEMNPAKKWMEIGRSEIVQNSINPEFVTRFKYTYKFEESQKIRVKIYDADNDAAKTSQLNLAQQDFAGETPVVYMGDIVSAANHPAGGKEVALQGRTKRGNATGTCMIRCEEMANQNGVVTLIMKAKGLTNLDGMFGKSDPFLRMSRSREIGAPLPMFRSEVVMNNLNPTWKKITVSLSALCNGDPYRSITFDVADYDSDGSHDFIGQCTCSLNDLLQTVGAGTGLQKEMPLRNSRTGKSGGTLICT
jgi:Ca2+-dependent lipid-binding protein